jgi:hypothetical protein
MTEHTILLAKAVCLGHFTRYGYMPLSQTHSPGYTNLYLIFMFLAFIIKYLAILIGILPTCSTTQHDIYYSN